MRLLFNRKYEVTQCHIRYLFGLFFHNYGITCCHSSFDLDFDSFVILNHPLPLAVWASGLHGLSFSATFVALRLHLHLHAEPHLDHLHNVSLSLARWACLELAIFGTRSPALRAVDILIHIEVMLRAIIHFLQSHSYVCSRVRTFLYSPLTSVFGVIK